MTTAQTNPLIGPGIDRIDGPLKVTGAAQYPSDFSFPNLGYAVLVQSTIAAGSIRRMDTTATLTAPGVLAVITHENAGQLGQGPAGNLGAPPPPPLQNNRILHYGQHIAVVVAETLEQATAASRLLTVDYDTTEALFHLTDPRAEVLTNPWGLDQQRGDVATHLASAPVRVEATYTTPDETTNPLGLFSTVAIWSGDTLTVHDTTQYPVHVRATLAAAFGVSEEKIRILVPFVGGSFGAGLRPWPHVILAALAAKRVNRPVKLTLTRPQMFTSIGHRPSTVQHIKIGASNDGTLIAIAHEGTSSLGMEDNNIEPVSAGTASAYACPHVSTRDRQVRLNIPSPGSMRAPGEAEGNFALECALDELAYKLKMDPLELRLRNDAQIHPKSGLPWSSRALRECYKQGAELFNWSLRTPAPRSMRDRNFLVGYGMAAVSYHWYQPPCQARVSLFRDGTAYMRSAATDIGTGTYTVMTQLTAELLGLPRDRVRFDLGDTKMPPAPNQGGSGLVNSLGSAVHAACQQLLLAFLDVVSHDIASPLRGCHLEDVTVSGGRLHRKNDPIQGEKYTAILARHGLDELTVDGENTPAQPQKMGIAPAGAFGAKFVEVRVDPDLGLIRVTRVVSAIDGGRILNEKLAASQIIGGAVGGIGMALLEEVVSDAETGRIANATFGDYLVPVNADVPRMDVIFVGESDPLNPMGTKGVGEVGLVGIAAALANAVYHATGKRIRDLPITLDKLLS